MTMPVESSLSSSPQIFSLGPVQCTTTKSPGSILPEVIAGRSRGLRQLEKYTTA